jgi:hypothetical protein
MRLFIFFLILFAVCSSSYSVSDDPNKLEGTWQVDLRPTPESEPYFKDFEITLAGENSFNGKFYDTEFSGGLLNSDWSKIYFGFTTNDMSGKYFHSGYLKNDTLFGMTYSEGRSFVMPWLAVRKK